ncbi:hypothetical protein T4E_9944 [Trichinella pseudospiralis]|uniref:Uncharacterized protein n=1 Tax=Trichinella pseudospiralis TaxID=6337 RepID=A0A0V0Y4K3_TRIPS|nr:hypothetical protein T4E_9944 [Trichinella pseudospiralis]
MGQYPASAGPCLGSFRSTSAIGVRFRQATVTSRHRRQIRTIEHRRRRVKHFVRFGRFDRIPDVRRLLLLTGFRATNRPILCVRLVQDDHWYPARLPANQDDGSRVLCQNCPKNAGLSGDISPASSFQLASKVDISFLEKISIHIDQLKSNRRPAKPRRSTGQSCLKRTSAKCAFPLLDKAAIRPSSIDNERTNH